MARDRDDREVLTVDKPELAIVDSETWERVQARLLENAKTYPGVPKRQTTYLFSSFAPVWRMRRAHGDLVG